MSIAENPQHRARWLQNVAHILAELSDLQTDIDIAIGTAPGRIVERLLLEADVHVMLAGRELDEAAARVRRIP